MIEYIITEAPKEFAPIKVEFTIDNADDLKVWAAMLGEQNGASSSLTYKLYSKLFGIQQARGLD